MGTPLDIDDSDLRLSPVVCPSNNPHILLETNTTTHTLFSSQNHQVDNYDVKPIRIIPEPTVIKDVDEDDDFTCVLWLSVVEYVNVDGGIVTGCLGDVNKFLKNGKLEKVVVGHHPKTIGTNLLKPDKTKDSPHKAPIAPSPVPHNRNGILKEIVTTPRFDSPVTTFNFHSIRDDVIAVKGVELKQLTEIDAHTGHVSDLAFLTVDSSLLLIWDAKTGLIRHTLQGHHSAKSDLRPLVRMIGGVGFVTTEMIKDHLPELAFDIKILRCGLPSMNKAMACYLETLGYEQDMLFQF
ncbi:hypothetical protein Tco_0110364 [Tanacetum coccineum]